MQPLIELRAAEVSECSGEILPLLSVLSWERGRGERRHRGVHRLQARGQNFYSHRHSLDSAARVESFALKRHQSHPTSVADMPPKNVVAKGGTSKKKATTKVTGREDPFTLFVRHSGTETKSIHASAKSAATAAWQWLAKEDLNIFLPMEWEIKDPRYGWQDASNLLITTEDFVGDDEELQSFFTKLFARHVSDAKFEAQGEDAELACHGPGTRSKKPFWQTSAA